MGPAVGGEAKQERKLVTVLFADVTGSTSLGEQLDPERLRDVMDTYFAAMRREIEGEGGTVEKFIGDAVMAAFGVPNAHEDDPARALRAALRMGRRLDDVNRELSAAHGLTLQIRIGVNTGEVLAAVDAAPGEPMVTGDAVNTAARLQAAAEPGEALAGERTAKAARGFRFGEPRELTVKGKGEPVTARALLAETEEPVRGLPGLRAPMVGRDQEMDLLRSVYGRVARERRPHLVTIYGDPGVGKSRLTREFLAWATDLAEQPSVVQGRCLPYGDGITYWPLAEILKSYSGVLDTDGVEQVMEKISTSCDLALAAGGAIDADRACAALCYTVGLEAPSYPMRARDPRQIHKEMHAAWRAFFTAMAENGPVIAVVEDIHWADPALLELLEELAERVEGGLLLLCPSRPELTERRPTWGGGRRNSSSIALDPLTSDQADRLISLLLAVDDLPRKVHELILSRAEGNPFFLEEIVRRLMDEELIVRDGNRWRAAAAISDVEVPDTVQGVLAARIDLLAPADKRALQLAAVVGRVFWPAPVRTLLNGDSADLESALDRLESRDLVLSRISSTVAGEPEYIFKHVLTRDVAYESLPRRERAHAHSAVADWIDATASARRGEFGELLAYHLEAAYRAEREDGRGEAGHAEDLRRRALEAMLSSSEDARRRFVVDKAAKLADRALAIAVESLERARALEQVGRTALLDYRGDKAWEAYREAANIRLSAPSGDPMATANACARAVESPTRWPGSMTYVPDPAEVDHYVVEGLRVAGAGDSVPKVRLLVASAFKPFASAATDEPTREDIEAGKASGYEAAAMAERLGRPDLVSAALDAVSAGTAAIGMYAGQVELCERRLGLPIDNPFERGDAHAMAAWVSGLIGLYPQSLGYAYSIVDEIFDQAEGVAIHCINWASLAEFNMGNWDRIMDEFVPKVQGALGEREHPYFMANYVGTAAFISQARRSPDQGRWLDRLRLDVAGAAGRASFKASWLMWVHHRAGERSAAEELERTIVRHPFSAPRPLYEAIRAVMIADYGRWDEVPDFLAETRAYSQESGLLALPVHLDRLEGRAELAAGDLDRAVTTLSAASARFGELSAVWDKACTDLDLADALEAAGRADDAKTAAAAAAAVFARLGSLSEIDAAKQRLSSLP